MGRSEDKDSNWQDLPVELLVKILSMVDDRTIISASGVCTGWRDAVSNIEELSFSWCKMNTSKLVESVAPKFSHLQVCSMRNNQHDLADQAVIALSNHCHELRALDLSKGTHITDASLFALARGCKMLERLNLSGCTSITEPGLTCLAKHCSNLKHLNLCGCSRAGSDTALLALARNCISLEALNLGWCERITDLGVTGLASWCSDLKNVDLCGCLSITDRSVIALADNCHHLRVLGLYSCVHITDAAMYALANSSKYRSIKAKSKSQGRSNPVSSTVSCITSTSSSCNEGSTLISRNRYYHYTQQQQKEVSGLTSLNLGMCAYLSAQAVQAVCNAFSGLHTCPEKHSLIISGCLNLISVHCVCVEKTHKGRH